MIWRIFEAQYSFFLVELKFCHFVISYRLVFSFDSKLSEIYSYFFRSFFPCFCGPSSNFWGDELRLQWWLCWSRSSFLRSDWSIAGLESLHAEQGLVGARKPWRQNNESRWWLNINFIVTPKHWGNFIQFDAYFSEMGWWNQQLGMEDMVSLKNVKNALEKILLQRPMIFCSFLAWNGEMFSFRVYSN